MKFKVYVDYTTEETPRPFYVGKGTDRRLLIIKRNKLHSAIAAKYGFDRRVIFETDDEHSAFDLETKLITEHDTYVYGGGWGANFTLGGEGTLGTKRPDVAGESHPMWGRKHSEESKRKNSESNKLATAGEKNGMYGKHHSEETRKKIGDNQRGWHQTDEAKAKLAEAAKRLHTGMKRSEESRKRMSEARKGRAPSNKVVGTVRIAGGAGPIYVVKASRRGTVEIFFPESGETAFLPIDAVRQDPIKL